MATATQPQTDSVEIQPRRAKAADKAVQHLQRLIDLRKVLPGETLPSAAAVSEEVGVNRVAVLQAFQMLQRDGLVVVRPGRGGARVVSRDDRAEGQRLGRAVSKRDSIVATALLREIIESGVARAAATAGLDPDQVPHARSLVRQMRRVRGRDEYLALDTEFHELLAEATGSPILHGLSVGLRQLFMIALDAIELPADRLAGSNREHERILAAIERGAAAHAADWAHRHTAASMELVIGTLGWDAADGNGSNGHRRAR